MTRTLILWIGLLCGPVVFRRPVEALQEREVAIAGVVINAQTGVPVRRANIALNGDPATVSDTNGRFEIATALVPGRTYLLTATRIGYERSEREITVHADQLTIAVNFDLEPVPVRLSDIEIEGEVDQISLANLTGFHRRRDNLPGHFFTRQDIRRIGAQRVTEVVRRVPGSIVYGPDNVFVDVTNPGSATGLEPRTSITFQRTGFSRGAPCEALVFVNDVQVSDPNIDWLVDPRSIVAMEVYTGASQVPAEYAKRGADCGVVVIWTDAPTRRQGDGLVGVLEVGGTVTVRMGDGIEGERFGIQMMIPLPGPVEFHPSFHLIVGNSPEGDAGWQLMAALKARPLGRQTPWYVGTGMTIVKHRISFFDSGRTGRDNTDVAALALSGVSVPMGPIRPFVEVQLLDPIGNATVYIAAGATILHR